MNLSIERTEPMTTPTRSALTEEFRQSRTTIYGIARRICGEDAAADVTQEVFLRVWRNCDRFEMQVGSIRPYLLTVARGVSIDHLRREIARRVRDDRSASGTAESPIDGIQLAIERERGVRLAAALCVLSNVERDAIRAAFFDDMTYREVAARFGIPEGTAKSRIRLGLRKLRLALRDLGRDNAEDAVAS
ncbi:MAG: sigma-70 family RNA polymerase sigma factor [Ilumatobacteraceae bacterium]